MRILCVGDVVGEPGVRFLSRRLPGVKKQLAADVCIVNGENADPSGRGITSAIADELFSHGADVVTGGNHCFDRAKDELFEETEFLLCPANFPGLSQKAGWCELDLGRFQLQVLNLSGVAFLEPVDNPFQTVERILAQSKAKFRVLDFHAESTAEKQAMGYWLDGRVSAVFGTHTHVPTADDRVLPKGTGYLTDVGMTGPAESVIGVQPELAIARQRTHRPGRFKVAQGPCRMDMVVFELSDSTGLCTKVERLSEME